MYKRKYEDSVRFSTRTDYIINALLIFRNGEQKFCKNMRKGNGESAGLKKNSMALACHNFFTYRSNDNR